MLASFLQKPIAFPNVAETATRLHFDCLRCDWRPEGSEFRPWCSRSDHYNSLPQSVHAIIMTISPAACLSCRRDAWSGNFYIDL